MSEAAVHETTVGAIVKANTPEPKGAKADAVVVTNENFGAYVDKALGKEPAKAAPAAESVEAKAAEELKKLEKEKAERIAKEKKAAEPDEPIDHPDEAKRGKLTERFSELTKARKTAEAAAKAAAEAKIAADARADQAAREAADLRAKYEPVKTAADPEPLPAQFTDLTEFVKAHTDWVADKTRRDDAQAAAIARQKTSREAAVKAWNERETAARGDIADYDAKLAASPVVVADAVRDAIVESEVGPQILYHLAENPETGDKWKKMCEEGRVIQALKEVGRLEAELSAKTKKLEGTVTAAAQQSRVEISRAAPPISPLNGGGTPTLRLAGSDEVPKQWTYEDYKAARKAGQIK